MCYIYTINIFNLIKGTARAVPNEMKKLISLINLYKGRKHFQIFQILSPKLLDFKRGKIPARSATSFSEKKLQIGVWQFGLL